MDISSKDKNVIMKLRGAKVYLVFIKNKATGVSGFTSQGNSYEIIK